MLIIGLTVVALEKTHTTDFIHMPSRSKTTANGPTPEQRKQESQVNADTKQQFIEGSQPNPSPKNDPEVSLTATEKDGSVIVYTKLVGISDGTCHLEITNGSKSDVQTAPVIYQTEYSICAGFSVPVSKLGSGNWNIKLSVDNSQASKSSSIQFEVK